MRPQEITQKNHGPCSKNENISKPAAKAVPSPTYEEIMQQAHNVKLKSKLNNQRISERPPEGTNDNAQAPCTSLLTRHFQSVSEIHPGITTGNAATAAISAANVDIFDTQNRLSFGTSTSS